MAKISVQRLNASTVRVTIDEGKSQTTHEVTVTHADVKRYAPGTAPERLVVASFEFLLEREPKESILSHFSLPVIERYFPDYPRVIRDKV